MNSEIGPGMVQVYPDAERSEAEGSGAHLRRAHGRQMLPPSASASTREMRIAPPLLLATALFAQTAPQIEKDIRTLAAPNMEGRGLDTKGIKLAASYIESRLRALGLEPAFGTSYRQPF